MPEQLMLSSFATKTVSIAEFTKGFRPWNNGILDWEIEYQGYFREDDEHEGYVEFHVIVEIREALVKVRKEKPFKKVDVPGYKIIVTQNMAFEAGEWENYIAYEESFTKDQLNKAFDVFQREILNIQDWIRIAESRARFIPKKEDVFECLFCGWVTDTWADDIICEGCGKRYWSDKLWGGKGIELECDMR